MAPKRKTVTSAKQSGNVPSKRKRQPPVKLRESLPTHDHMPTTLQIDEIKKQQVEKEKQMVAQSETQKVLMEQQKEILDLLKPSKTATTASTCTSSINDDSNDDESNDAGSKNDSDSGECKVRTKKHKPVMSGGLSVGQSVPLKKIWKHKYVDFHELLNPHNNDLSYTLSLDSTTSSGQLSLNFSPKFKKYLSENQ